jgi:hypothetical protein
MVATLAGLGALLLGLALLLLPLLATELSRPGDSAWGALVLVLALVLVTSADRLTGSPMLAVISGGLLIGRLTVEVGRGRWRQLSAEEQGRLGSWERWRTSVSQANTALLGLMEVAGEKGSTLLAWWQERRQPKTSGKRWVRPEEDTPPPAEAGSPSTDQTPSSPEPAVVEVRDFEQIDALLQAAPEEVSEEAPEEGLRETAEGPQSPHPSEKERTAGESPAGGAG